MNSMPHKEVRNLEISEEIEAKIERRERKKKPKMKVSGKRVFQLKQIKQRSK